MTGPRTNINRPAGQPQQTSREGLAFILMCAVFIVIAIAVLS